MAKVKLMISVIDPKSGRPMVVDLGQNEIALLVKNERGDPVATTFQLYFDDVLGSGIEINGLTTADCESDRSGRTQAMTVFVPVGFPGKEFTMQIIPDEVRHATGTVKFRLHDPMSVTLDDSSSASFPRPVPPAPARFGMAGGSEPLHGDAPTAVPATTEGPTLVAASEDEAPSAPSPFPMPGPSARVTGAVDAALGAPRGHDPIDDTRTGFFEGESSWEEVPQTRKRLWATVLVSILLFLLVAVVLPKDKVAAAQDGMYAAGRLCVEYVDAALKEEPEPVAEPVKTIVVAPPPAVEPPPVVEPEPVVVEPVVVTPPPEPEPAKVEVQVTEPPKVEAKVEPEPKPEVKVEAPPKKEEPKPEPKSKPVYDPSRECKDWLIYADQGTIKYSDCSNKKRWTCPIVASAPDGSWHRIDPAKCTSP